LLLNWVSFSALLAIQFGFAALLGALVGQTRAIMDRVLLAASALLFVGASVALPMALMFKLFVWAVSILLFIGFLDIPLAFRSKPRFAWLYIVFAMALVITWSAAQAIQPQLLALGAAAALAAGLAWRRGNAAAV
jgi:hypothetical protein